MSTGIAVELNKQEKFSTTETKSHVRLFIFILSVFIVEQDCIQNIEALLCLC